MPRLLGVDLGWSASIRYPMRPMTHFYPKMAMAQNCWLRNWMALKMMNSTDPLAPQCINKSNMWRCSWSSLPSAHDTSRIQRPKLKRNQTPETPMLLKWQAPWPTVGSHMMPRRFLKGCKKAIQNQGSGDLTIWWFGIGHNGISSRIWIHCSTVIN